MLNVVPIDPNMALSPLADPVVSAIYANAEVAGLAIESFISAVLESNGEALIGKVKTVTPQRTHGAANGRGCRLDIESETDANERTITEVQIDPDRRIMIRNLFASAHVFRSSPDKGDTVKQMADKMPRIIHINILGYNIRKNSTKLVEPFKIMYTEQPAEVAISNFSGYNIQLPNLMKMEPDFTSNLYCWCYTLYTAHKEGKTVREVIEMTPALQEYAERDAGFKQYSDRYDFALMDPKILKEYVSWAQDRMREEGMKEAAFDDGMERGADEFLALLNQGLTPEEAHQKIKSKIQKK